MGVVAEQFPKGGALTLNAISGIGMLAVGTLGFPYIGTLQTKAQQEAIVANEEIQQKIPGLVADGKVQPVTDKAIYEVIKYQAIDDDAVDGLIGKIPEDAQEGAKAELTTLRDESNKGALKAMSYFPAFMLVCYIILIVYFKSKGGYEAKVLTGHDAVDEEFTGGVEGAMEG